MIDLLGIGLQRADGAWLFRRLSARLEPGQLAIVASIDRDARTAVLDTIVGRRVPGEGRAWVVGLPVSDGTARHVRARVAELDLRGWLSERRSVLWNAAVTVGERRIRLPWLGRPSESWSDRPLAALASVGLERRALEPVAALDAWSRRRLLLARALATRPTALVAREVDAGLSASEAADVLGVLRTLAESERVTVVATAASDALVQTFAHRIVPVEDRGRGAAPALAPAVVGT